MIDGTPVVLQLNISSRHCLTLSQLSQPMRQHAGSHKEAKMHNDHQGKKNVRCHFLLPKLIYKWVARLAPEVVYFTWNETILEFEDDWLPPPS